MRIYRFVQLDVFTETPFMGNPLAVFPDATGLSGEEMQLIAREMNLSESTFVLPPRDARAAYRVRIFTPGEELPYAGHPSIGTAHHLASEGRLALTPPRTRFHQDVDAGILAVDVESDVDGRVSRVFTTQVPPRFERPFGDRELLAEALALDAADVVPTLPVQVVSTGVPWLIVPLRDVDAVTRVNVSPSRFAPVAESVGSRYLYVFAVGAHDPRADTHSRGIVVGEFEDPVTGSASGCLGAYLAEHRVVEVRGEEFSFVNEQGSEVKRPGLASVEVSLDGEGTPSEVRVGGPAVEVLRGEVRLQSS